MNVGVEIEDRLYIQIYVFDGTELCQVFPFTFDVEISDANAVPDTFRCR